MPRVALGGGRHHIQLTGLVCRDVLASNGLLLLYLGHEELLTLREHIELRPEVEDGTLGCILALLRGGTAKPTPHPDSYQSLDREEGSRGIEVSEGQNLGARESAFDSVRPEPKLCGMDHRGDRGKRLGRWWGQEGIA